MVQLLPYKLAYKSDFQQQNLQIKAEKGNRFIGEQYL